MSRVKENLFLAVAISVIVLGVPFLFSNTNKKEEKVEPHKVDRAIQLTEPRDDSTKELYMDGCVQDGVANTSYCACTYDEMIQRGGTSGLIDASIEYNRTGELPDSMLEVVRDCLYLM